MKLLVLGGTRFLGRHVVAAALARGHAVTLFNRGRTEPGLFVAEVEKLVGDRDGGLSPLQGRRWDAVIDTCGYLPRVVRQSARLLERTVGQYQFVSSVSVYADSATAGQDESARRAALADPACEDIAGHYGALKAACEDEVAAAFGARALLVRPGLIVGPFDPSGRFTYWVRRMARGGLVLAPADPQYPVQFIDARDLADWMVELAEGGRGGVFNASGPAAPLTFGAFLEACRQALRSEAELLWPDEGFLAEQQVAPWTELPLYAGPQHRGISQVDLSRALSAGLRLRELGATCVDTLSWVGNAPQPTGVGLSQSREAELLRAWRHRARPELLQRRNREG